MHIATALYRLFLFITTFAVGVVTVNTFGHEAPLEAVHKTTCYSFAKGPGTGSGSGECSTQVHDFSTPTDGRPGTNKVNIKFQPKGIYTDKARENGIEGVVCLKITFLASGQVGQIEVVKGLPDGLTEQAVAAAKRIEFEPATVDGVPVSRIKTFEYNFSIY
jgi:TonB family protein